MALTDGFLADPELRDGLGAAMMQQMHNSSLLIHMAFEGSPAACKEHVLPAPGGFFCPEDGQIVSRRTLAEHEPHLSTARRAPTL